MVVNIRGLLGRVWIGLREEEEEGGEKRKSREGIREDMVDMVVL